jgi:hypothetical protein
MIPTMTPEQHEQFMQHYARALQIRAKRENVVATVDAAPAPARHKWKSLQERITEAYADPRFLEQVNNEARAYVRPGVRP